MTGSNVPRDDVPLDIRRRLFDAVLDEAGQVSEAALGRLDRLVGRYPAAVPGSLIDQLRRSQHDPTADRRVAVRLGGGSDRVAVRVDHLPPVETVVLDRSVNGIRLRFPRPIRTGTVLVVQLPEPGGDWYPAGVRYCRPDGEGWAVGCEFVADRPPA